MRIWLKNEWLFAPVCVVRGRAYAIAEDGYVEYGRLGSSYAVERISHFVDWRELKTVDDVVALLVGLAS